MSYHCVTTRRAARRYSVIIYAAGAFVITRPHVGKTLLAPPVERVVEQAAWVRPSQVSHEPH
jgi:hypothetical protein